MAKKARALPRRSRVYPQTERLFSTNFQLNMNNSGIKCWIPNEDYRELERRYIRLFKRYQREKLK